MNGKVDKQLFSLKFAKITCSSFSRLYFSSFVNSKFRSLKIWSKYVNWSKVNSLDISYIFVHQSRISVVRKYSYILTHSSNGIVTISSSPEKISIKVMHKFRYLTMATTVFPILHIPPYKIANIYGHVNES